MGANRNLACQLVARIVADDVNDVGECGVGIAALERIGREAMRNCRTQIVHPTHGWIEPLPTFESSAGRFAQAFPGTVQCGPLALAHALARTQRRSSSLDLPHVDERIDVQSIPIGIAFDCVLTTEMCAEPVQTDAQRIAPGKLVKVRPKHAGQARPAGGIASLRNCSE